MTPQIDTPPLSINKAELSITGEKEGVLKLPPAPVEEGSEPLVEKLVVQEEGKSMSVFWEDVDKENNDKSRSVGGEEASKSRSAGGEELEEENNDKSMFDVASVEECIERVIEQNIEKFESRVQVEEEANKMVKTKRKRLHSDERPDLLQCGFCRYSTRIEVGLLQGESEAVCNPKFHIH